MRGKYRGSKGYRVRREEVDGNRKVKCIRNKRRNNGQGTFTCEEVVRELYKKLRM